MCLTLAANQDPTAPGRFPIDPFVSPLLQAPGAIVAFLLRRWEYRSAWVNEEDIDENVSLNSVHSRSYHSTRIADV
ncbi:MAG: hypothetical protein H7X70_02275 [Candidatus Kapabacteria bacterium]|nr:hypothetical protein [Candidatus Kapabacteria bacterium]